MEELPATEAEGALLGLPETQTELDNLTEFNTAHNRRISMLGIPTEDGTEAIKVTPGSKRSSTSAGGGGAAKKLKRGVSFNEDVEIINPEDIDPTIGRFRNLVRTTIVPNANATRKLKLQGPDEAPHQHSLRLQEISRGSSLYSDLPAPTTHMSLIGARLGMTLPNPAPDVELESPTHAQQHPPLPHHEESGNPNEPKRKKYAKEAWPGRKPGLGPI